MEKVYKFECGECGEKNEEMREVGTIPPDVCTYCAQRIGVQGKLMPGTQLYLNPS